MKWDAPSIRRLVRTALAEDAVHDDITTQTLIPAHVMAEAVIRVKGDGVVCGLPLAAACFRALDAKLIFVQSAPEGRYVRAGGVIARIRGRARAILSAERSALNAVQYLSGIATVTRRLVRRLDSRRTFIYETR